MSHYYIISAQYQFVWSKDNNVAKWTQNVKCWRSNKYVQKQLFSLCYISRGPFIEMLYVCIIRIVLCMARLLVDHPFSTINWWNSIIWMSETLRRIHLDELTLLSDNLGLSYFWVIQVLLTSAGLERSASKQHSLPGLHYPGGLRPSRFITSGFKMFVRFSLAPGFMVNTEIVSSNRRQTLRPVAQQFTNVM